MKSLNSVSRGNPSTHPVGFPSLMNPLLPAVWCLENCYVTYFAQFLFNVESLVPVAPSWLESEAPIES